MTDFRALCAELTNELHGYASANPHHDSDALVARARAALAAKPQGEGPSDEEIAQHLIASGVDALQGASVNDANAIYWEGWHEQILAGVRAAIAADRARWGRPAPPPTDGEVGELVAALRSRERWTQLSDAQIDRAADLLARLALQPVPVSERLPGPEDCVSNPRTGSGQWCWGWVLHDPSVTYSGRWRMMRREWLTDEATHWLPAQALPLPTRSENV